MNFFLKRNILCIVDDAINVDFVHEQEEKNHVYFILGKFRRNMQLGLEKLHKKNKYHVSHSS
jgi:hypothetical protein